MQLRLIVCFMLFQVSTYAVPLRFKRAFSYIANETACTVDHIVYKEGDPIPTDDPCESCKCRPPGFSCVLRECEVKTGCKAIRREGECCPEYQCGCEHNGNYYRDGDRIPNAESPCYSCYCQGSSITCSLADCKFRFDCEPEYVLGECCPRYDHCPPEFSVTVKSTTISQLTTTKATTKVEPTTQSIISSKAPELMTTIRDATNATQKSESFTTTSANIITTKPELVTTSTETQDAIRTQTELPTTISSKSEFTTPMQFTRNSEPDLVETTLAVTERPGLESTTLSNANITVKSEPEIVSTIMTTAETLENTTERKLDNVTATQRSELETITTPMPTTKDDSYVESITIVSANISESVPTTLNDMSTTRSEPDLIKTTQVTVSPTERELTATTIYEPSSDATTLKSESEISTTIGSIIKLEPELKSTINEDVTSRLQTEVTTTLLQSSTTDSDLKITSTTVSIISEPEVMTTSLTEVVTSKAESETTSVQEVTTNRADVEVSSTTTFDSESKTETTTSKSIDLTSKTEIDLITSTKDSILSDESKPKFETTTDNVIKIENEVMTTNEGITNTLEPKIVTTESITIINRLEPDLTVVKAQDIVKSDSLLTTTSSNYNKEFTTTMQTPSTSEFEIVTTNEPKIDLTTMPNADITKLEAMTTVAQTSTSDSQPKTTTERAFTIKFETESVKTSGVTTNREELETTTALSPTKEESKDDAELTTIKAAPELSLSENVTSKPEISNATEVIVIKSEPEFITTTSKGVELSETTLSKTFTSRFEPKLETSTQTNKEAEETTLNILSLTDESNSESAANESIINKQKFESGFTNATPKELKSSPELVSTTETAFINTESELATTLREIVVSSDQN